MSLFEELGLRRFLNAEDTFTANGASCMSEEVSCAMREVSQAWVDLEQMQKKTGEALARLTNNEAAYVSAGAANALTLCAAMAVSGGEREAFLALPDVSRCGRKEVVVLAPQKNSYCRSIAASGAVLRWAGNVGEPVTLGELEAVLTEKTAALFYFVYHGAGQCPSLESILELAGRYGIPVFVDAAAQLPPAENLWKYTGMGADLALFSGGKGLAGPQDSGLIVGKRHWIDKMLRLGTPHEGICRGSKVTRETMAGLYTAVKRFVMVPEPERQQELLDKCQIARAVMERFGFSGIQLELLGPVGQASPRVLGRPPVIDAQTLRNKLREDGLLIGWEEATRKISFHPQMLTREQTQEACRILENRLRAEGIRPVKEE